MISVISLNEINESAMEHESHLFIFCHCLLCLLVPRFLASVKFKPQTERKKSERVWKNKLKILCCLGTEYSEGFDERGWLGRLHKPPNMCCIWGKQICVCKCRSTLNHAETQSRKTFFHLFRLFYVHLSIIYSLNVKEWKTPLFTCRVVPHMAL